MLHDEERRAIDEEVAKLPERRAACIRALQVVQNSRGWVDDRALEEIAAYLDMDPAELDSVATFYNLIFRRPVGRHVIYQCTSVSCWIVGSDPLQRALCDRLGICPGETAVDGRFTLLPIRCLGLCHRAPVVMVDDDVHTEVATDKLEEILSRYQ